MKGIKVKKIVSLILGVMMIGSLVACRDTYDDNPETAETSKPTVNEGTETEVTLKDSEIGKIKVVDMTTYVSNINNIQKNYREYGEGIGINFKFNRFGNPVAVNRDEKYGSSEWLFKQATGASTDEDRNEFHVSQNYKFNKELLDGNIDIKDTGISDFIINITKGTIPEAELIKIQEKFIEVQVKNEGEASVIIENNDWYYNVSLEFNNNEKTVISTQK